MLDVHCRTVLEASDVPVEYQRVCAGSIGRSSAACAQHSYRVSMCIVCLIVLPGPSVLNQQTEPGLGGMMGGPSLCGSSGLLFRASGEDGRGRRDGSSLLWGLKGNFLDASSDSGRPFGRYWQLLAAEASTCRRRERERERKGERTIQFHWDLFRTGLQDFEDNSNALFSFLRSLVKLGCIYMKSQAPSSMETTAVVCDLHLNTYVRMWVSAAHLGCIHICA